MSKNIALNVKLKKP